MISTNCVAGEHKHCGGILKFADPTDDMLDVAYPCDCACHRERAALAASEPKEPRNG